MPLETFNYLDSLNASYPAVTDGLVNGDDHIRGIKSTLQATFPGVTGPLTRSTAAGVGLLVGTGGSAAPTYSFTEEPTLGFYRSAAGVIRLTGGILRARGAVPAGAVVMFPKPPTSLGSAANTGTPGFDWIECDGSVWSALTYPELADFLNPGQPTFTVPNMKDTGRFPRSRTATFPHGVPQSADIGGHQHSFTTNTTGGHAHNFSGTTGGMNAGNPHGHTYDKAYATATGANYPVGNPGNISYGGVGTSLTDINHGHPYGGATDVQGYHNHSGVTDANAGSETRPEALSFVFCIKT